MGLCPRSSSCMNVYLAFALSAESYHIWKNSARRCMLSTMKTLNQLRDEELKFEHVQIHAREKA